MLRYPLIVNGLISHSYFVGVVTVTSKSRNKVVIKIKCVNLCITVFIVPQAAVISHRKFLEKSVEPVLKSLESGSMS